MGTVLWDVHWFTSPEFTIEKSAIWGFAWVWQPMCILNNAPDLLTRENLYGGYRVRLNFSPFFWAATSSAWKLGEIFVDAYALAPASSTPISMGAVNVGMLFYPAYRQYVIVVEAVPNVEQHVFWHWPEGAENAGSPNMPAPIPDVFFVDGNVSLQPLPPVYC